MSIDVLSREFPCDLKFLKDHFKNKFGASPQNISRTPGRVNLIGEHIDYCGYSVLPMALEQTIDVAFLAVPGSDELIVDNIDPKYEVCRIGLSSLKIEKENLQWSNYFLCGVIGVVEEAKKKNIPVECGIRAVVSGKIPPSAGLSSSSALVCSGAVVTNEILKVGLSRSELASLCAKSERFVGTEGGGMDQAIAMMAERGFAKLIDFNPLRATDVRLPEGSVFVVFNSLVEANKAAFESFNHRVVEGRIGTMLLARRLGLTVTDYRKPLELQKIVGKTLEEMAALVTEHLHEQDYTKEEVCLLLDITPQTLEDTVLTANTKNIENFKCKQRLLHVFTEAARVHEFKKVCDSPGADALARLGQLMNASHASCRDLYDCSHPQLDRLVEIVAVLAYGARLTGAGWGGCAVALVPASEVDNLLKKAKTEFYDRLDREVNIDTAMFVTSPGDGAKLLSV